MLRRTVEPVYERSLVRQIRHMPRHIAIIQDGNRRFAGLRGLKRKAGHRAGADRTEEMLEWIRELGVRYVTLYSFSTENFNRDSEEVQELFDLFKERFTRAATDERIHRHHIRIQMVGERSRLPEDLKIVIERAEEATSSYESYFLNFAIAYGGRNEIVRATKSILEEVRKGIREPGQIDRLTVERHICADHNLPPVDLVIRTGNESRTSNFLPWLANGHESAVYFCAPFWPMFRKIDLLRAIRVYSQRIDTDNHFL
jgi:tritrans,polycis-undecaprenyl-diphosphate synthase [geranylgeranyl-diphosphate specific]